VQRRQRLRRRSEFAATYSGGKSWTSPLLVLRARENGGSDTRFGFAVGRRLGNAVLRNRLKRQLRAIAREATVVPGWDIVVIARRPATESRFADLKGTMERLLSNAGLQREDQ
jgi:ribonuclease P protein component